jgi:LPXTG-motif cell wall-anchored protein
MDLGMLLSHRVRLASRDLQAGCPTERRAGRTDSRVKEKEQMSFLKTVPATVFCLTLLGAVFSPVASADAWNRKTVMTFSGPVEIPGVHLKGWQVLPAGTYVFKIVDSQSNRHIVQIFNKEETKVYATILAIPNYRLRATGRTAVTFRERPAGQPPALRAWFYPGRNWGEEFVYSRAQAIQLAKATNTVVLYTTSELPMEVTKETLAVSEPEVAQLREAPVAAIQPSGEDVEIATAVTPPPAAELEPDTAPTQVAEMTLPKTASSLPLIGLLGLLALGGAWALGLVKKRVS